MKLKKSILSAALVICTASHSMAQTTKVYSTNVVGYVNLNLGPGYSLVTLPLQNPDPTSSINSVLTNTTPTVPFGAYVLPWIPAAATYGSGIYAGGDGNWYDASFNFEQTNSLPPGDAFFVYLPGPSGGGYTNVAVTVYGTVLQGTNSITQYAGYGFYGNFEPVQGDITTNGFPIEVTDSYLYTWNYAGQHYDPVVYGVDAADNAPNPAQFYDSSFTDVVVIAPPIGAGFVYFNLGAQTSWNQTFTVQ